MYWEFVKGCIVDIFIKIRCKILRVGKGNVIGKSWLWDLFFICIERGKILFFLFVGYL